jgi:hypothetical protein
MDSFFQNRIARSATFEKRARIPHRMGIEKLAARDIVMDAGMSARPEFYSGRGATRSDLNSTILQKIYDGVSREHGKDAGDNFAQMVADIPKLSATDFLITLYRLEGNEWKWSEELNSTVKGLYAGDYGSAFGTVMGVLSGMNDTDETEHIRSTFLWQHDIKPKQGEWSPKGRYGY